MMLADTHPLRQRVANPVPWALTSGVTGLVACCSCWTS